MQNYIINVKSTDKFRFTKLLLNYEVFILFKQYIIKRQSNLTTTKNYMVMVEVYHINNIHSSDRYLFSANNNAS